MDGHGIIHNLPMDRAVSGGMCSVSDLLHLAQATDAHDPAMLQVGPKVRSVIEVCRKMGIRDVPKWQFLGGQMMTNYRLSWMFGCPMFRQTHVVCSIISPVQKLC